MKGKKWNVERMTGALQYDLVHTSKSGDEVILIDRKDYWDYSNRLYVISPTTPWLFTNFFQELCNPRHFGPHLKNMNVVF